MYKLSHTQRHTLLKHAALPWRKMLSSFTGKSKSAPPVIGRDSIPTTPSASPVIGRDAIPATGGASSQRPSFSTTESAANADSRGWARRPTANESAEVEELMRLRNSK